jgi:hypothetical protein
MTEPSWDMSVLALSHLTKSQDSCLNSSYEVSISFSGTGVKADRIVGLVACGG